MEQTTKTNISDLLNSELPKSFDEVSKDYEVISHKINVPDVYKDVDMVRHRFHLHNLHFKLIRLLAYQFFESWFYLGGKDFSTVLGTPN